MVFSHDKLLLEKSSVVKKKLRQSKYYTKSYLNGIRQVIAFEGESIPGRVINLSENG